MWTASGNIPWTIPSEHPPRVCRPLLFKKPVGKVTTKNNIKTCQWGSFLHNTWFKVIFHRLHNHDVNRSMWAKNVFHDLTKPDKMSANQCGLYSNTVQSLGDFASHNGGKITSIWWIGRFSVKQCMVTFPVCFSVPRGFIILSEAIFCWSSVSVFLV